VYRDKNVIREKIGQGKKGKNVRSKCFGFAVNVTITCYQNLALSHDVLATARFCTAALY
jgi:hypothetical protein